MSQPVGSTSWSRGNHDSNSGAGSLRSSRLRSRHSRFRSNHSFRDTLFSGPESSSSSSGEPFASGSEPRSQPKAALTARVAADAQTSLTLDSSLVASSFTRNGVEAGSETSTASLTSSNNFINFCATVNAQITDGKQLVSGSCNPAPMGQIPSIENLPSILLDGAIKGGTFQVNTTIPFDLYVANFDSGVFVNLSENFMSAPQQVDSTGNIIGHYHVVVEELDALNSTIPTDSRDFVFFKVISDVATDGFITSKITNGLPEGFYRLTATTHAANHQPVLVPISQHGAFNDVAYFTVTATGTAGSSPAVRRRAPRHVDTPRHSETRRTAVSRADDASQSSLTLLSSVIAQGFASDGQDIRQAGQSASLTSSNNFINFCATTTLPLTNGTQVRTGFCNPAPMGVLPSTSRMPTSKFTYPRNSDVLRTNSPMIIGLAVTNLATGNFANEETAYLSAPQQLDSSGQIQGHPFIVIEQVSSSATSTPPNPLLFTFFKGVTGVADSTGVLTTTLDSGLPAGFYRMSSIIATTNGQPILLPVLERGAVDDAIYFVVADGGELPTNQTAIVRPPGLSASASGSATRATESSTPSASNSAAVTPSGKSSANIAAAVGGALAGIAIIALVILAFWLINRRRRNRARAEMLEGHPVVLNGSDFGVPPPTPFTGGTSVDRSMSQVRSPPSSHVPKSSRGPPSSSRRLSVVSAAPSYHTQI